MTEHSDKARARSEAIRRDEYTLGAIALIMSIGLLKANEVFDFFDRIDVFVIQGDQIMIRGPEFLAAIGFIGCYIYFAAYASIAVVVILSRDSAEDLHLRKGIKVLGQIVLLLALGQFCAFGVSSAHFTHKYGDMTSKVKGSPYWVFTQ